MDADDLHAGVAEAGRRLIAAGIGAVQDLGARNDLATVALLDGFVQNGTLPVALSVALGSEAFARGERTASSRLVKLMVNDIGAEPLPPLATLAGMIAAIDAAGLIAAVHCVTAPAVEHAVAAFERVLAGHARDTLHRLEHAAVCPPELARRIAALPLRCVLNPALICLDGDRYLREMRPESLPWLHNPATLVAAGAPIAAGSDAPVAAPAPLVGVAAMTARRSRSGETIPGAVTSLEYAIAAHTAFAADAAGATTLRGRLVPGSPADLVVLPRGWDQAGHCGATVVARTMLGGRWRNV
jgi:predicted amidohydrolase YtcJ